MAVATNAAAQHYRGSWTQVASLDDDATATAGAGNAVGQEGQAGATGVRQTAQSAAAAIAPTTGNPAGMKMLVSTMDDQMSDMQRQIEATKAQNQTLATRFQQQAADYQSLGTSPTAPGGGIQAVDYKTAPPPPAPPPIPAPSGLPGPLQDYLQYQVQGKPIPNPPARNVTADQLRQEIINQTNEYHRFVDWFNKKYGGNVSPGDLAARVAAFQGSTISTLATIPGWPEAIPGTLAGVLGMFASGWSLFSAEPPTAQIPVPEGPP
jgi:hypothetical protein